MYIAHIYFFIVSCVLSYFLQCVLFCNSLQLQSYVFPTSKTKVVAIWKSQQQKLCSVHLFAIRRSMCADLQLSKLVLWQWTNPTSSTRWCMFLHFPKMTSGAGLCMCELAQFLLCAHQSCEFMQCELPCSHQKTLVYSQRLATKVV